MTDSSWLAFFLLCLAMELTPGPNMAYLAILTLSSGRRAGFTAIGGIALGLTIVGVLAALGVAALISESPLLYHVLSATGFVYLLWLAWDTWRTPTIITSDTDAPLELRYFTRGIITNLLNPKAFVFYVTVLPGFIGSTSNPTTLALQLTGLSVLVASSVHIGIVSLAGQFKAFLSAPSRQKMVRRLMALLLVLVAIWFASVNMASSMSAIQ